MSKKEEDVRYLVIALRKETFDPAFIAPHKAFLNQLRDAGVLELAGPFSDGSGGAYILRADSFDAAKAIAMEDPLHTSGSSYLKVYEWDAQ